jgi:hypothetical protein
MGEQELKVPAPLSKVLTAVQPFPTKILPDLGILAMF